MLASFNIGSSRGLRDPRVLAFLNSFTAGIMARRGGGRSHLSRARRSARLPPSQPLILFLSETSLRNNITWATIGDNRWQVLACNRPRPPVGSPQQAARQPATGGIAFLCNSESDWSLQSIASNPLGGLAVRVSQAAGRAESFLLLGAYVPPASSQNAASRQALLEWLGRTYDELLAMGGPVYICGDLNMRPHGYGGRSTQDRPEQRPDPDFVRLAAARQLTPVHGHVGGGQSVAGYISSRFPGLSNAAMARLLRQGKLSGGESDMVLCLLSCTIRQIEALACPLDWDRLLGVLTHLPICVIIHCRVLPRGQAAEEQLQMRPQLPPGPSLPYSHGQEYHVTAQALYARIKAVKLEALPAPEAGPEARQAAMDRNYLKTLACVREAARQGLKFRHLADCPLRGASIWSPGPQPKLLPCAACTCPPPAARCSREVAQLPPSQRVLLEALGGAPAPALQQARGSSSSSSSGSPQELALARLRQAEYAERVKAAQLLAKAAMIEELAGLRTRDFSLLLHKLKQLCPPALHIYQTAMAAFLTSSASAGSGALLFHNYYRGLLGTAKPPPLALAPCGTALRPELAADVPQPRQEAQPHVSAAAGLAALAARIHWLEVFLVLYPASRELGKHLLEKSGISGGALKSLHDCALAHTESSAEVPCLVGAGNCEQCRRWLQSFIACAYGRQGSEVPPPAWCRVRNSAPGSDGLRAAYVSFPRFSAEAEGREQEAVFGEGSLELDFARLTALYQLSPVQHSALKEKLEAALAAERAYLGQPGQEAEVDGAAAAAGAAAEVVAAAAAAAAPAAAAGHAPAAQQQQQQQQQQPQAAAAQPAAAQPHAAAPLPLSPALPLSPPSSFIPLPPMPSSPPVSPAVQAAIAAAGARAAGRPPLQLGAAIGNAARAALAAEQQQPAPAPAPAPPPDPLAAYSAAVEAFRSALLTILPDLQRLEPPEGAETGPAAATFAMRQAVAEHLALQFNQWFEAGTVPRSGDFTHNSIASLEKKGGLGQVLDPADPANRRGIAVGNLFPKALEQVLLARLSHWSTCWKIIAEEQVGFMPGMSAEMHVMTLRELLLARRRQGLCTQALFLDLKKAYGMVHPEALFAIMMRSGCPENLIGLLRHWSQSRNGSAAHQWRALSQHPCHHGNWTGRHSQLHLL